MMNQNAPATGSSGAGASGSAADPDEEEEEEGDGIAPEAASRGRMASSASKAIRHVHKGAAHRDESARGGPRGGATSPFADVPTQRGAV
jgi:hypothetical protein